MPSGNGAKAACRRERVLKDQPKEAKSQLKANAAAMSIQCKVCMNTFLCTAKRPMLEEHSNAKHPKHSFAQCFPTFTD